jgi:hypothetical protein
VNDVTTPPEQAKGKAKAIQIPQHYEVGTAANLLGMSVRFIKTRCKAGEMEGYRLGNRIVVTAASIRSYLDNRLLGPRDE